jgi:UDP-2,3-diacylglucosamine hydrolase
MMGKQFAQRTGCKLLHDSCIIDLYGTRTLLLHGDSLCIDDVSYQRYRRWTRSKLLQWCFLHLPSNYRQGISDKIKQKSHQQKQHKVKRLIHGHTHRPDMHPVDIDGQTAHRIVLGDWEDEVSYLLCDEQHCQLVDHRIKASLSNWQQFSRLIIVSNVQVAHSLAAFHHCLKIVPASLARLIDGPFDIAL